MDLFTADHNGFYFNDKPFYPLIQEANLSFQDWSNIATVRLPAHLDNDLLWTQEKQLAEQYVASGKFLFWEVDFGLSTFTFSPEDSASFFSFSLALEEFSKQLWPLFGKHTFGVGLYRGAFDPLKNFPLNLWEPTFLEWSEESGSDYALYCAQNLSEYLHRLSSFLPDAALPFCLFDVSRELSAAKMTQLFSKVRFEHIYLALKGSQVPFSGICWEQGCPAQGWIGREECTLEHLPTPTLGICFPQDTYIDDLLLQEMDRLISRLKMSFRIIPEEKLTEEWNGLDKLIVFSKALSPQGKRKLLGFIAAGGVVATVGEPIGLEDEEIITV